MQKLDNMRNIGIIAHIDAGKTTITEGMLYFSGCTHRFGNIDEGTTVMDYLAEERQRGITIVAAAATIPWQDCLLHLIDTPGHIDFTAEVERSLRVIDGAVVIFSGVEGVEAQSEKVWRQADTYSVPKIAFINKLDRIGASFQRVLDEINRKFGGALALQEPVGIEDQFNSVVDLLTFQLLEFGGPDHDQVERKPVPDELRERMLQKREELIESLADESDELAVAYLEGDEIPVEKLRSVIRDLTLRNRIVPVFAGSAKKQIGVQPLMDAAIEYLPSPADCDVIPAVKVKTEEPVDVRAAEEEPFAGFIFKLVADPSADLLYMRTYSGTLKQNATLINARTGDKVRAKQILRLYAKNTQTLEQVGPGDIVGVIGPKGCGTGDTLCETRRVVSFERITFPEPVISIAVEPRYSRDRDKLAESLELLCREDPTLSQSEDEDTGQLLLSGMGELHLEINLKRLRDEFKTEARTGQPRVAYRETLKTATSEHVVFARTIGENELYAEAEVAFSPLKRGEDLFKVEHSLRNENEIPKAFVQAAVRALSDGLRTGGNHGYPLIYLQAELKSLIVSSEKTTEGAVVGAVLSTIDQAIRHVGTRVLEPLMHLEIITTDETVGEVTMYLQPRRAVIHEMTSAGQIKRISCEVPLAEMFGFSKALPKLTGGRASFTMEPCGYQELPAEIAQKMFGAV